MNAPWLAVAAVGLVILALSIAHARRPSISDGESRVFRAVNRLPGVLYGPIWVPMQLGNLVVGTGAGLVVAFVDGDVTVGIGVVLAAVLKLVAERVVRHRMAGALAVRQRPGVSQPGAVLRGSDVPESGPSFPSGHVILVAGVASVVAPVLPGEWWWVPVLATALVMFARVYVGAHNPLDVSAGLGAGMVVGGVLASLVD
jgi:membrane-associated phospholipid phosphatase